MEDHEHKEAISQALVKLNDAIEAAAKAGIFVTLELWSFKSFGATPCCVVALDTIMRMI